MPIPRMRTAEGVLAEIKAQDPNTDIKLHYIRQIIRSEQVAVINVGRKKLVNLDDVIAFLSEAAHVKEEVTLYGQIRPVKL